MSAEPVLILTGPPGSGKTTVARLLTARWERAAHVEADHFFHFIASGYVAPWKRESHEQNKAVMRIVGEATVQYARAGYRTVADGIFIPGWFFEPVRDSLEDAGLTVAYAVLRPPLPAALDRARGRNGNRVPDPGVVEQLWNQFSDLGVLERHVVELNDLTAEEAAAVVAERLDAGELNA